MSATLSESTPARTRIRSSSPEYRLLFVSARVLLTPTLEDELKSVVELPLDWAIVRRLAERNGTSALLLRHLNNAPNATILPALLQELRSDCVQTAANNLYLAAELQRILGLLSEHEIHALPWKGPTLAALAYRSLADRSFGDLDILVRPHDVRAARQLLEREGYQRQYRLTPAKERALLSSGHEEQMMRDDQLVELHWRLAKDVHAVPFDFDGLWNRQESIAVGQRRLPCLATVDLLLSLCIHASSHAWRRLIWVCDIAEITRNSAAIDWDRVLGESEANGYGRMVRVGLLLAADLLDAPLPCHVTSRLAADPVTHKLVEQVSQNFALEDDPQAGFLSYQIGVRQTLVDKAALLGRALFRPAPEDWTALSVPDAFYPFYYLVRPMRLLAKHGASFFARG